MFAHCICHPECNEGSRVGAMPGLFARFFAALRMTLAVKKWGELQCYLLKLFKSIV